jgi:RNA-binding protein YhbY
MYERKKLVLGKWRQEVERQGRTDGGRDRLADQLVERVGAHDLEHRGQICVVRADVALGEF